MNACDKYQKGRGEVPATGRVVGASGLSVVRVAPVAAGQSHVQLPVTVT